MTAADAVPAYAEKDPSLRPFLPIIQRRLRRADEIEARLVGPRSRAQEARLAGLRTVAAEHERFAPARGQLLYPGVELGF